MKIWPCSSCLSELVSTMSNCVDSQLSPLGVKAIEVNFER